MAGPEIGVKKDSGLKMEVHLKESIKRFSFVCQQKYNRNKLKATKLIFEVVISYTNCQ